MKYRIVKTSPKTWIVQKKDWFWWNTFQEMDGPDGCYQDMVFAAYDDAYYSLLDHINRRNDKNSKPVVVLEMETPE